MAEDKVLLKKDIINVLKIDARIHYNDLVEVQKIHDAILEKGMFSTYIGKRYVEKMEKIAAGENDHKCFFCGKDVTEKSVICDGCILKIMPKSAKPQPKEEKIEKEEIKSEVEEKVEEIKEEAKEEEKTEIVDETKEDIKEEEKQEIKLEIEKIKIAKEKLQEFFEDSKKQESKEKVLSKIDGLLYYVKSFWNSLSGMSKIIAVAITVLVVSVIIGVCTNEPGSEQGQGGMNITNADAAVEVLETIFPEEEYNLKYQQLLYPAEAMFDGEIGKYCGESWSAKPSIDAYVISVQSIEKPRYSCICYVSIDGRIIGYGSLIYEADTSAYFRLK